MYTYTGIGKLHSSMPSTCCRSLSVRWCSLLLLLLLLLLLRPPPLLLLQPAGFPTFDYFSDQPWMLEPGYLDGLSAGAVAFFQRFRDAFAQQISAKQTGEIKGYTRYLAQAREHVEAMGVDAGVLARL